MCNSFYSNKLIYLFLRKLNNFVGFTPPSWKNGSFTWEASSLLPLYSSFKCLVIEALIDRTTAQIEVLRKSLGG